MKTTSSITGLITLFLFLFMNTLPGSALAVSKAPEPDSDSKAQIVENYGKLSLSFEKNQGQTDKKAEFLSRGGGYSLFLTPDEAVLALSSPLKDSKQKASPKVSLTNKQETKRAVIRMKLSGANPSPVISGQDRLTGTSNYFIGNDPLKWRTHIPKYEKVRYREVYPGIDLIFYGNQRRLEYDFVVSPGSDPSKIKLEFKGAQKISLDGKGNLVLRLKDGEVIQKAPLIYQEVDGKRIDIAGGYLIDSAGRVGCQVASWDRQRPLVIDPVLVYSTYLGGSSNDCGYGIAVDGSGNAYVTGATVSSDFPTVNALYPDHGGGIYDAFIFKLSADGSQAVYSTYLGGSNTDYGYGIAVDGSGNAYVTGATCSSDFPAVNALYPDPPGHIDAFIFKLSADGSQAVYSTYLGGWYKDYGYGIAVDGSGNAYVTGETWSSDFPTVNALYPDPPGHIDAFIFKLSADGSQAVYSTYLGGNSVDYGFGIAADTSGNAYVTGYTWSSDFPTVNALDSNLGGSRDAFIFKLSADGSQAVYSTYLGGNSWDIGYGIAADGSGNAYVTGYTWSSDFPTVNALYPYSGSRDAFIFKLSADGSQAVYSTYLGGSSGDRGLGIAADGSGNAYVTGETSSWDFPTVNALYPDYSGWGDAFIFKLSADGSQAVYSTYLGGSSGDRGLGIAADRSGNAYVTGDTNSTDFPMVNALYPDYHGHSDVFIAKINFLSPLGEIHGSKWNDLDGDGVWDDGEPGLENWKIYLDENANGQWDSGELYDLTDSSGNYSFADLEAGTHVVAEVLQLDWTQTYPSRSPGARLGLGGPTTYGDMLTPEELERIERMEMKSPPQPPPGIENTIVFSIPQYAVMLSEVPTSRWTYGSMATAAGMIFGYYDRTGFSDMYTGPTNGGVAPLTDLGQGIDETPIPGSCSIIATQNGFDGRTVRGHVDDYWIDYDEPGPDPWEGNWPEHTWEGCTADYIGTSQWKWDFNPWPDGDGIIDRNHDGKTTLFVNNNSEPLPNFVPPSNCGLPATALCHGLRLFAESRGYTVEENYTQCIDTLYPGGFSFADYMAEINAGRPVMIHVTGHSMVGVGYYEPTQTVYLHNTLDNNVHFMTWGGDYVGMDHLCVTVIHLAEGQKETHTVTLAPGEIVNDINFGNNNQANHDPVLTSGDVEPDSGDSSTLFTYTVHYYDQDGDSPSTSYVYIDGSPYIMTLYSGSASDGTYQYQSTLPCSPDPHDYYFEFTDVQGGSDRLPDSGTYSGPDMDCPPLDPVPDIKANGSDGPITVPSTDPVSITISLDPGDKAGQNADWWIAATTPFAPPGVWYSYVYPTGWFPGINLCIQAPLFTLSPFEVLNMVLPSGDYTFYFAVDSPDGSPAGPWYGMDTVEVQVQ